MKKIVFLVLGVALLLVLNFTSVPASAADDDDGTPNVPVWIEATYRITFINMTTMNISSTFAVHKICIDENNFTADSIRENYTDNPEVGMEIINKTMEEIDNAFNTVINTTFANDTVESEPTSEDKSTIIGVVPGGDEYQPPINFTKNATITFNMTSFGFEENPELNLDDVLRGTLKMGAVINKAFELKADAGYVNRFILHNPKNVSISSAEDEDENITVTWTVNNLDGTTEKEKRKTLTLSHEKPEIVKEEEILINLTVDMYNFDELYLDGTVDIKSVNITKYNVSLPSNIRNLSYISSDGLRMALENNLVTWEDIENEINKTKKDAEEMLNNTFNTMITLNFTWYNLEGYNLPEMGSGRAINATFVGFNETESEKIKPNLFGDFDAETITGILNAGAKYGFDISSSDQNYTLSMILPENMIFSGYSQKVEHTNITNRNAYSWSSSETLSCKLESGVAPEYNESRALLNVLIDMHNIDIFGMMLNMDLGVNAEIYCIKLSDVSMPKNLTMKYINSDCLRLLYDKGIIKQSDIDNITDEIKKGLEENLTTALGGNVSISVYIDYDSLKHYNVNNMSDVRPVSVSADARISISLEQASSSKSSTQAMSLSFLTFPLEFPLSGMEGFNTTYKIILPKGINVLQADDTLGRLQQGTKDGRTYLTITLNETEKSDISITIDATGLVLNIMLPFIILSVIMTVAGIVVWLMKRKEGKLE